MDGITLSNNFYGIKKILKTILTAETIPSNNSYYLGKIIATIFMDGTIFNNNS